MASPSSSQIRHLVEARAKHCCEYCKSPLQFAIQAFCVEHIIPSVRGGGSEEGNLALACQGCNNHKYTKIFARDPASGAVVALFHPRKQRWREHFAWNDDATIIVGLSPSGRATIDALQLNRAGLIALRRLLYAAGEHPPQDAADL